MRGALEVELEDEADEPGLRFSAKHGFVEAARTEDYWIRSCPGC
jgi:hypothetical protein